MRDATFTRGGDRTIGYTDIGAPEGAVIVYFHGAPASRLDLVHLDEEFACRHERVISVDRPGYGTTSPLPGRSMSDALDDVVDLLDELGLNRFVLAGHSSGAPYALALSAAVAERCLGTVLLDGVTQMTWADAWSGYPEIEVPFMRSASEDEAIGLAVSRFGEDGSGFLDAGGFELPAPDIEAFADPVLSTAILGSISEAFHQGVGGYAQDLFVQGRPWPFDPASIHSPVLVVHGELDTLIPMAHSRHTADLVTSAVLRIVRGHGHLTVLGELPNLAAEFVIT